MPVARSPMPMRRFAFASVMVLAAMGQAAEAPPATAETASTAGVVKASVAPEKTKRVMSAQTAAKLAEAAPYFAVSPMTTTAPETGIAVSPVAKEPDKPRNQIFRLPPYIVGEPKVHLPSNELQVLTLKGRTEYAMARRPGLRFGSLGGLNQAIALEMLEDDLQAERRAAMAELLSLYTIKEPATTAGVSPPATKTR